MSLNVLGKIKKTRKRGIHKTKRDTQLKIAEWIYPSIGVKAWLKFISLKLKRKPISSHKIALGFAFGAFVSFTPFMGLHGFVAIVLAYIFGASITSAILGTVVGNPWTFPLIWVWTLNLGNFILYGKSATHTASNVTVKFNLDNITSDFSHFWETLLMPMTIGGIPTGIIAALVCYLILRYQIDKFRDIRKNMLKKRKEEIKHKKIQALKNFKDKIISKES